MKNRFGLNFSNYIAYKFSQLTDKTYEKDRQRFHVSLGIRLSLLVSTTLIILVRSDIRCKIPFSTTFMHGGVGVVCAKDVKLGGHCVIGQNVTLGGRHHGGVPKIGWGAIILPHAIVIGDIRVGTCSVIGAGSVVLNDIPPYSLVVGSPGKVIKTINTKEYWSYRRGNI